MSDFGGFLAGIALVMICFIVYFLPAMIANRRRRKMATLGVPARYAVNRSPSGRDFAGSAITRCRSE
jgi:hypothetical protein